MSQVKAEAVTGFVHGPFNMKDGDTVMMERSMFDDLERAGLVKEAGAKSAPVRSNKMAQEPSNKGNVEGSGEEQQSSSSQAAPASTETTLNASGDGANAPAPAPAPAKTTVKAPAPAQAKQQQGKKGNRR